MMPTTKSLMIKSLYRSFLGSKKTWNIRVTCATKFWLCVYVPCLVLVSMYIYSFIVSNCWDLNCGFNALFVTPQGLLMRVLMSYQRSNN